MTFASIISLVPEGRIAEMRGQTSKSGEVLERIEGTWRLRVKPNCGVRNDVCSIDLERHRILIDVVELFVPRLERRFRRDGEKLSCEVWRLVFSFGMVF